MKKKKLLVGVSTLLMVTLVATGCGRKIEVKNGSKVAVSTKEDKFTATEYYEKIKKDNISILVDMIDHSILDSKYKEDDKEKEYVDNQVSQIKSYYGSDEATYKNILQQYFGVETEDELKTKISLEYKRNKAVEDYIEKNIKDDEIQKYYDEHILGQVSASHILISVDVKDDASDAEKQEAEQIALDKAKDIINELNDGKKFSDLAKKYSNDKATATKGGDLGYFNLEDMVSEFSEAVQNLKDNEYTKEPVKTEYGYHIILRTGEKDKPKLKDKKDEIKEKIREKKLEEDATLYYETLKAIREDNGIKWNDDDLKQAYDDYMNKLIDNAKQNS